MQGFLSFLVPFDTAPLRATRYAYTSNLNQDQWELLEPLIRAAQPGGRPREVNVLEVLNAIFYLLTQGCTWRNLAKDFPAWQTVYTYLRNWRIDRTWVRHDRSSKRMDKSSTRLLSQPIRSDCR